MRIIKNRGFTLIELLAVIAIIAVLSSVIIASLSGARAKGRDAKRIADIKNIELALKLYAADHSSQYPNWDVWETELVPNYLPSIPKDPLWPNREYQYASIGGFGVNNLVGFVLGAVLETDHSALNDDVDYTGNTSQGAPDINGASAGEGSPLVCGDDDAGAEERCFDVRN